MIPNFGGTELIILLVIILLLFGASRIPNLARSLGSGMREFRKGASGDYEGVDEEKKEEELTAGDDSHEEKSRLEEDASAEADRAEQNKS